MSRKHGICSGWNIKVLEDALLLKLDRCIESLAPQVLALKCQEAFLIFGHKCLSHRSYFRRICGAVGWVLLTAIVFGLVLGISFGE